MGRWGAGARGPRWRATRRPEAAAAVRQLVQNVNKRVALNIIEIDIDGKAPLITGVDYEIVNIDTFSAFIVHLVGGNVAGGQ
jgi:hypothetical protein